MTTNATQRTEREAVLYAVHLVGPEPSHCEAIKRLLDAYGQARELAGHVDACGRCSLLMHTSGKRCPEAKAIMEEAE